MTGFVEEARHFSSPTRAIVEPEHELDQGYGSSCCPVVRPNVTMHVERAMDGASRRAFLVAVGSSTPLERILQSGSELQPHLTLAHRFRM